MLIPLLVVLLVLRIEKQVPNQPRLQALPMTACSCGRVRYATLVMLLPLMPLDMDLDLGLDLDLDLDLYMLQLLLGQVHILGKPPW